MRAHIIENGFVVNTIEVTSLQTLPNLVEATEGGIGWAFDGTKYTAPLSVTNAPIVPVVVPTEVTMRQARLALLQLKKLAAVTAAIAASTDDALKIEWEFASTVKRTSTSTIAIATALTLTDADLDKLFTLADTL